jgi:hypothetical protein
MREGFTKPFSVKEIYENEAKRASLKQKEFEDYLNGAVPELLSGFEELSKLSGGDFKFCPSQSLGGIVTNMRLSMKEFGFRTDGAFLENPDVKNGVIVFIKSEPFKDDSNDQAVWFLIREYEEYGSVTVRDFWKINNFDNLKNFNKNGQYLNGEIKEDVSELIRYFSQWIHECKLHSSPRKSEKSADPQATGLHC